MSEDPRRSSLTGHSITQHVFPFFQELRQPLHHSGVAEWHVPQLGTDVDGIKLECLIVVGGWDLTQAMLVAQLRRPLGQQKRQQCPRHVAQRLPVRVAELELRPDGRADSRLRRDVQAAAGLFCCHRIERQTQPHVARCACGVEWVRHAGDCRRIHSSAVVCHRDGQPVGRNVLMNCQGHTRRARLDRILQDVKNVEGQFAALVRSSAHPRSSRAVALPQRLQLLDKTVGRQPAEHSVVHHGHRRQAARTQAVDDLHRVLVIR